MTKEERRENKDAVWAFIKNFEGAVKGGARAAEPPKTAKVTEALSKYYADDAVWEIFHPFNTLKGSTEAAEQFWLPLFTSFPDLERRVDIFAGDLYKDEYWVTAMGHLTGNFSSPWLGIQPTGKVIYIRLGEFHKVKDGKIVKSHILLDIPDVMRQAGCYPFRPMPAAGGNFPGPKRHNGIRLGDDDLKQETLDTVLSMHKALHDFDGKDLNSMEHSQCWSENFFYHAACGIGTTRGMEAFKKFHQQPFLKSFPDRHGRDHYCRISDGPVACTTHWGTLTATHLGSEWFSLPATGKKIEMRVADWYCADEEGKLHENWLFIDILHIMKQMGCDLLESRF